MLRAFSCRWSAGPLTVILTNRRLRSVIHAVDEADYTRWFGEFWLNVNKCFDSERCKLLQAKGMQLFCKKWNIPGLCEVVRWQFDRERYGGDGGALAWRR